ncbi:MAG: NTP transferase domain-containing protein [Microbacteriaceae bacterium]|nr:NTP transferase domain-containing protein [Microbacteriaceae bacterium]
MSETETAASSATRAAGVVLAAGAGSRYGVPKALARAADGTPWVQLVVQRLLDGGCSYVTVVLGASAAEAAGLIPVDPRVDSVVEPHWTDGAGASLRAGVRRLKTSAPPSVSAALVTRVDLPDLPVAVVKRLVGTVSTTSLRHAALSGRPVHPIVIGRQHWPAVTRELHGEADGLEFVAARGGQDVEAGDLWSRRG